MQGYKDTRMQGYKDARIQGYKDTRIQGDGEMVDNGPPRSLISLSTCILVYLYPCLLDSCLLLR